VKGKKELVCKLKKSLYGLKQSPRMWYKKFDTYMLGLGFTRSKEDHYVYFKLIGDHLIYLVLYVDDMLLIGNNKEIIQDVKTQLSSKFDMKDLGAANFILGMEIKRDRENRKLWLNQRKYVETILQRFNMQECKPVRVPIPVGVKLSVDQCPKTQEEEEDMSCVPYASVVGSLMYAMVCTRPDIAHAVGVLSRYMSKPGKEHWTTIKRFSGICVALLVMDCATKEDQVWTECWTYMDLWMQTGLEIWIVEDLQVGMCLTCLEENQLDEKNTVCSGTFNYKS
jgi:hypothetical protein